MDKLVSKGYNPKLLNEKTLLLVPTFFPYFDGFAGGHFYLKFQ